MFCPNPECPDIEEVGEPGEYVEGIAECPVCGTALVAALPEWADHEAAPDRGPLVEALEVTNAALLPLAKSLLEAAGIDFIVRNEEVQGLFGVGQMGSGFNMVTGPPAIHVGEKDVEAARAALAELSEAEDG